MGGLILSREHYTVDVLLAFYITYLLFKYVHFLADQGMASAATGLPFLSYFESNMHQKLPNEYEWPFISVRNFIKISRKKKA